MRIRSVLLLSFLLVPAPRFLPAQERGAAALHEEVRGLGVTTRVLMIGAHPDDEDTQLITWLARGQRAETAYLSLTRGDGGQNIIGNELGDALGVIRTQELLAARRVDGGRQYFTRAFDFGFSKSADETFEHWDRSLLLRDVVTVVRAFRPHVIISVFSGTPRDGHGHHQVSGMLAREAFDVAGDSVRMPSRTTGDIGPWTPLKFYRAAWFNPAGSTLRINVGEYNPVLGRSYAEIAGESRSQHRSQAFGTLQPRGVRWDQVTLEASRVSDVADATRERSLFDGVDGGWSRFASLQLPPALRATLDSLPAAQAMIDGALSLRNPSEVVPPLALHVRLLRTAHDSLVSSVDARRPPGLCATIHAPLCGGPPGDLAVSLQVALRRGEHALINAAGVSVEANAARAQVAARDTVPVVVEVYNRGRFPVHLSGAVLEGSAPARRPPADVMDAAIAPDSVWRDTLHLTPEVARGIWWLERMRSRDMFNLGDDPGDTTRAGRFGVPEMILGEDRVAAPRAVVDLEVAGTRVRIASPIVYKYADPSDGEIRRPIAVVPAITVLLERQVEYLPAGRPVERTIRVAVQSAVNRERAVTVALQLPPGLRTDSLSRTMVLRPNGRTSVVFTVRGALPAGWSQLGAVATSEGQQFTTGFVAIEYPHIAPQRLYRQATTRLSVVDVRVPATLNVAYLPGVGDNVPPMLTQLGVPVTVVDTAELGSMDLSSFTTVVVGPRAYEASESLVAANARLLEFVRRGGTVVAQYGQYEMMRAGMMPYPITISRPHDRVTMEGAPVRFMDPQARLLGSPNAITAADFDGWVQERALYMPRTFDPAYVPLLEMHDPGAPANRGAVLVAPYGRGIYVYTTLSFFRQLPAGVPGAARVFVNLLGAGLRCRSPDRTPCPAGL